MSKKVERLMNAARACLGTPFHHQGRKREVGLDCIGLVIEAFRAIGFSIQDQINYSRRPDGVSLVAALEAHGGVQVSDIQSGDVLVFRFGQQPQHVAIATSSDSLIHSFAPARRVVETVIGPYWRRRLVAIYRFDLKDEA